MIELNLLEVFKATKKHKNFKKTLFLSILNNVILRMLLTPIMLNYINNKKKEKQSIGKEIITLLIFTIFTGYGVSFLQQSIKNNLINIEKDIELQINLKTYEILNIFRVLKPRKLYKNRFFLSRWKNQKIPTYLFNEFAPFMSSSIGIIIFSLLDQNYKICFLTIAIIGSIIFFMFIVKYEFHFIEYRTLPFLRYFKTYNYEDKYTNLAIFVDHTFSLIAEIIFFFFLPFVINNKKPPMIFLSFFILNFGNLKHLKEFLYRTTHLSQLPHITHPLIDIKQLKPFSQYIYFSNNKNKRLNISKYFKKANILLYEDINLDCDLRELFLMVGIHYAEMIRRLDKANLMKYIFMKRNNIYAKIYEFNHIIALKILSLKIKNQPIIADKEYEKYFKNYIHVLKKEE